MGAPTVYRLLYASRVSVEAGSRLPSAMEDILLESVRNNRRDHLTGLLICNGIEFAQVLEGEEAAVEACFERIAGDPRNTAVALKRCGEEDGRIFSRWSMCGLYLSELDDALLQPSDIEFDLSGASPGALLQLLKGLADRFGAELDAAHEALVKRAVRYRPSTL